MNTSEEKFEDPIEEEKETHDKNEENEENSGNSENEENEEIYKRPKIEVKILIKFLIFILKDSRRRKKEH